MNFIRCRCISGGNPSKWQIDKPIKLIPPFPNKPFGGKLVPHKPVYIDKCIVKVIEHLWEHNIYTKSSCCGHNCNNPSIVVDNNMAKENAKIIKKLISQIDKREWDICSWVLTTLL